MKKIVSLMLTAMIAVQCLKAQVPEGIKHLNYEKIKSARGSLQTAYNANPKDAQTVYWYGQAILATDGSTPPTPAQIQEAKTLYQKALNEIGSDPWLLVGMGHVEIQEGGDLNAAKQKFEQAITASTETKGRNKGKANAGILAAIGRANAEAPAGKGDNPYAIDKLKQAALIDPTNPDILINLGINYLKMGGENGGEAVKAYQQAISIDPKHALAMYRIGKIYQSQNNKDLFEQYFNNAIAADAAFPLAYHALYEYYSQRDVNRAKEYLDKYIASADKSPENEIFVADYLFRAGKNAESLAKLKELEAGTPATALPKLNLLYAYNYDRLGDSIQAKANLEKYFSSASADIKPQDYELAVKVFSKFPGSEKTAIGYVEKALATDTSKENRIAYMGQIASLYGKAKMVPQQLEWLHKQAALKGGGISEYDFYAITSTAFNNKDYAQTIELAKAYMKAYPDKKQPYTYLTLSAKAMNTDSMNVLTLQHINYLDSVYATMDKEKYKKDIFLNQYYLITTYYQKKLVTLKNDPSFKITTDGQKTPIVDEYLTVAQEVINLTESMIAAYPDAADENNKWAQSVKADIQKRIDYYSKPPGKKTSSTSTGAATATAGKKDNSNR
jgi:predicted Zn-dependent protease